jgi:hypothetical protein
MGYAWVVGKETQMTKKALKRLLVPIDWANPTLTQVVKPKNPNKPPRREQ